MKKMAKAAALLAAMVLAAGLTACQGKGSSGGATVSAGLMFSNGLIYKGAEVAGYTYDVPAKLSIPKGVSGINENAFNGCLTLESVTIPDTVTYIGSDAFKGCKNLKSVNIPASVRRINYSFEDCASLKEVKYAGTKAQWEEIKKYSIGNFVVHCTDGDVTVGGED